MTVANWDVTLKILLLHHPLASETMWNPHYRLSIHAAHNRVFESCCALIKIGVRMKESPQYKLLLSFAELIIRMCKFSCGANIIPSFPLLKTWATIRIQYNNSFDGFLVTEYTGIPCKCYIGIHILLKFITLLCYHRE